MKTALSIALFMLFTFGITKAQSGHLSFKNIPINGTLNEFVEKLKNDDFILSEINDNIATMKGTFVNKSCELYIVSSPKTNIVWKVIVYLPKDENWYSLKIDYKNYKDQFIKKYGKQDKSYEFFSKPYYEGDGYEIQALNKEKCTYISFWEMSEGSIFVSISKYSQISFTYEDAINVKKTRLEKESNIQDDI